MVELSFLYTKNSHLVYVHQYVFTLLLDRNMPPVWDPGEGKNRPTLLSWPDVVRAD